MLPNTTNSSYQGHVFSNEALNAGHAHDGVPASELKWKRACMQCKGDLSTKQDDVFGYSSVYMTR